MKLIKKFNIFFKKSSSLDDKEVNTFTKVWMSRFFWLFSIWVTLSYLLAFLGKDQIAESLSSNVVQFGIVTVLGYLCKSFFETHSEEKLKYQKDLNKVKESGEKGEA